MTDLSAVVSEALRAIKAGAKRVSAGFSNNAPRSDNYLATTFNHGDERWVVCTAHLMPFQAQLLDATVHQVLRHEARGGVAILKPRTDLKMAEIDESFFRRYQQIAWSAFKVLFVVSEGPLAYSIRITPATEPPSASQFDELAAQIASALRDRATGLPRGSHASEEIVHPLVEEVLIRHGFTRTDPKGRQTIWRRSVSDGRWSRDTGWPRTFGLEVKRSEDIGCPVSQLVELLAWTDAALHVRVTASGEPSPSAKEHPLAKKAKQMLEKAWPVQYLELEVQEISVLEDLVRRNRSYRRFHQEVPVDLDTLRALVNLARLSASSANLQPLKYILSCHPETNTRIFPHLAWAGYLEDWPGPAEGERPAAYVVVLGDTTITKTFGCDHGIVAQSIMLGATERGLGGCIIGSVSRDELRKTLNVPTHLEILLLLALGKPKEIVLLDEVAIGGDIRYFRDGNGIHNVPKRSLRDVTVAEYK